MWINGTIANQGRTDETNIQIRFLVNLALEDSTVIPSLLSSQQTIVGFQWTPPLGVLYNLSLYAVPVSGENNTNNNQLFEDVTVTAYPDVWINPNSFDFTVMENSTDSDILTVGNTGLANLDFQITTGNTIVGVDIVGTIGISPVGGSGLDYFGQGFTAQYDYISDLGIVLAGGGTVPDMRVQLWGDSGGLPDRTNVIASSPVIPGSMINSTYQRFFVSPSTPIPSATITAGATGRSSSK